MDKEIIDDFVTELRAIERDLKSTIEQLIASKLKNKALFEKFGQTIDRVYGTAATLGFQEVANYAKAMKDLSYKASQSDNEMGAQKTTALLINYLQNVEKICQCIYKPAEIKKIHVLLLIDITKAETICRSHFFSIERISCEAKKA